MKDCYYICPHCEGETHRINWLTPAVFVCEHCRAKTDLTDYKQLSQVQYSYTVPNLILSACLGVPMCLEMITRPWVNPVHRVRMNRSEWFLLMAGISVVFLFLSTVIVTLSLRPSLIRSLTRTYNRLYQAGKLEKWEE